MEHSVIKQLKTQLLTVVLEKDPEASVQIFAMAAMHGDVESLDLIIEKVGNKLGNLEEMLMVRNSLAELIKDMGDAEARQKQAEAQAATETANLLNKFKL